LQVIANYCSRLHFLRGYIPLFDTLVRGELRNLRPRNLAKLETSTYRTFMVQNDNFYSPVSVEPVAMKS